MLRKFNALLLISIIVNCTQAQKSDEVMLIKSFSKDLFNESIPSDSLVANYLTFDLNDNEAIGEIRAKASAHVEAIRERVNEDGGWLMPNFEVANAQGTQIGAFIDYEHLDSANLKVSESELSNVFVLLNSEKTKVLQYFYVLEGKILSFSLLAKPDGAWFFTYN